MKSVFKYRPNTYTADLKDIAVYDAVEHAKSEFPNECCGAIIEGDYVPFKNESENPDNAFVISDPVWYDAYIEAKIDCLVHSHNDWDKASLVDQEQQQELMIPSLIINLRNRSLLDCIVFGTKTPAPLEGRPFFYGAFDCLALVGDYVFQETGFRLPNPPHEWEFWAKAENPIEQMIHSNNEIPFVEIDKSVPKKKGDILLYNMFGTRFINHMAVVWNDQGEVLHHLLNNVSGRYPITYGRKYLQKVMRHI